MSELARPARTPWGLVVLLGSFSAMGAVAIDMYLPSMPTIGATLNASPLEVQSTMAAFLVGMAIGQLFYGPASDRFGRKPPLLFGLALFVLTSIACAVSVTAEQLIGARFVQGLAACSGAVVARAVVRDRFGHTETARMLSLMMLIVGVAPILAPIAGGAVLLVGSWRMIFAVITVFALLLTVATLLWMKESRSEATALQARAEHPVRAYLLLLRNPRLVGYALAAALNGATLFTYISCSPDLVINVYGIPTQAFGVVFGINAVAVIGANQINRHILRKRNPDQVLAGASLVSTGFAIAMALAAFTGFGGMYTVLPLLFCVLGTYGFIQGNTMASALSLDVLRAGSASALLGAFSFAAGAGGAWLVGLLHDNTARPMAFVILTAVVSSTALLHFVALPKRAQGMG